LQRVIEARGVQSRRFFDSIGPEWDALRKVFNDDALRARAVARLVTPGLKVADVGTGTAILACELGRLGLEVIAIDHSRRMLEAAQEKIESQVFPAGGSVELRHGEANDIPIARDEVEAALAHMVLHYVASPAEVVREMARIVKPGGAIVIVDFVQHSHEWMRQELGVVWMGFAMSDIRTFFSDAGLPNVQIEEIESAARGRDLPATFIAWARLPTIPVDSTPPTGASH
jgi:ArsR family transcriptional regulator